MRFTSLSALATALLAACAPGDYVAITHATVITATGAPPIADATVLIRDGIIQSVGQSGMISIPRNARVIDASGKFLLPGLIDMHAHTSKTRASALGLYITNGVTTIRDVGSEHAEVLEWRRQIRSGARIGPRMVIAGPYLESQRNIDRMRGDPPESRVEPFERARIAIGTPARAKQVIDSLSALEIDFFKIRTVQDRDTYRAIVDAAHRHGKDVVGHTNFNSPEEVLSAGQKGVEHGWNFSFDSLTADQRMTLWKSLAKAGVGVTPTLVVYTDAVFISDSAAAVIMNDSLGTHDPRRKYVSRFLVQDWREQFSERNPATEGAWRKLFGSFVRNYREMREAGVLLMAGSDIAVFGIYPGSALHKELENFVVLLGMSPLEAIERATRVPAEFMHLGDSVGSIQPGRIADLLLLDDDPLADIRNTKRISAVVLRGRVFDRAALDSLDRAVLKAEDLRVNDWKR
jgi:imidazolonepropionase-like amidohydrolase